MSTAREPLQSVVVVGAGQVGAVAALALKRALPHAAVTIVGIPPDRAAWADRIGTALPFTQRLHERLGIAEEAILGRAFGSHRLALHCIGWGERRADGSQQHELAPYGDVADPALHTRFAREWGGGRSFAGDSTVPGTLAELFAAAGRFAPLPGLEYGLRWNVDAYLGLLADAAMRAGVSHVGGAVAAVDAGGDGGIDAIRLESGQVLQADLFVDCSGPGAVLLSRLSGHAVDDWSAALPVREIAVLPHGPGMVALEDRATLGERGWLVEFAGRDGLQSLAAFDGAAPADTVETVPLAPGAAREPWLGNVVALGDAAAIFEPLGFLNLDLAHRQLALLLEMLPGRTVEPSERAEYNRRAGLMAAAVRDTIAAFYAAPRARALFASSSPPALAEALDQFTRRGRLPFRDEAPLTASEWPALLAALGFAQGIAPQWLGTRGADLAAATDAFRSQAEQQLSQAPPYEEWLRRTLNAPPRG